MKILTSLILVISMMSNLAFADCDFKTGITPGPNNTFVYTEECHKKVGLMTKQLVNQTQQIADLNKAIQLKDLALDYSNKRTELWMDTTFKLEQNQESIESMRKKNEWLFFALGALTVFGAGVMAAQLSRR